jgi:hypothetical protein
MGREREHGGQEQGRGLVVRLGGERVLLRLEVRKPVAQGVEQRGSRLGCV